jgi:hypothetical protein
MIGAPAATEPLKKQSGPPAFQFYQYKIRWPACRVERSLKTVALAESPVASAPRDRRGTPTTLPVGDSLRNPQSPRQVCREPTTSSGSPA